MGGLGETQMNFHSICVLDKWFNAMSRQKFNVFVSVCYCIRLIYTDSELCYVLMDGIVEKWSFSRTSLVFCSSEFLLSVYFLLFFLNSCFVFCLFARTHEWPSHDLLATLGHECTQHTHSTRQSKQACRIVLCVCIKRTQTRRYTEKLTYL